MNAPVTPCGIAFSRGHDESDNQPEQRFAASFDEFQQMIFADRSLAKGETFFCGPLSFGPHDDPDKWSAPAHYRLMSHALTRRFLPTDQDGYASPQDHEALFMILERFRGFGYETWSHTPGAPRTRAVIELDRDVDRAEGIRLGEAFDNFVTIELGPDLVSLDKSVYRHEQPVYAPGVSAKTFVFSGEPLQVDDFLAKYAPVVAPVQSNQGQSSSQSASPKQLTADEIELIKDLRSALLHLRADDRDLWIRMGMALRTLDDVGRGLWLEWSATSSKFDPIDAGRVWDSFTPTTIDHKSVFAEAKRCGWLNPKHHLALTGQSAVVDPCGAPEKLPNALMPVKPLDTSVLPTPFFKKQSLTLPKG